MAPPMLVGRWLAFLSGPSIVIKKRSLVDEGLAQLGSLLNIKRGLSPVERGMAMMTVAVEMSDSVF